MVRFTDQDSQAAYAMMSRPAPTHSSGPSVINIMDVLSGLRRRKLFVLGMGLAAFALAFGLVKVLKPVYTTEAQVLIQNLETPYDQMQPPSNQHSNAVDDRVVASQMSVLKSEDLGRRVVAALSLEKKAEFNPLINGVGPLGRIKIALGFGSDPRLKTPDRRALDHYIDELDVFQLPGSNVIGIKYSSADPEMAAQVANTLADTYVVWTRESQSQPTERAREWLSSQISALRDRLAASEAAVERFRADAGLLQGATTTLGTQEISELNSQITVAKSASLDARAKANAIRDLLAAKGNVESATDVLASSSVQRLKEQRTDASRRLAELSVTYLSNHPKIVAVRNEIANIDKQMHAEALKVVASLDEQARIAESRLTSLEANLASLKTKEETSNLNDVKLKALQRDAAADRALLEAMLSRYAEANARQELAAQPGLGVVIQSAGVPSSPSFPKSGPMVVLITIAGLSFGLGLAFLMELMAAAARLTVLPEQDTPRSDPAFATAAPVAAPSLVVQPPVEPAAPRPVMAAAPPPIPVKAEAEVQRQPSSLTTLRHLAVWPKIVPQSDMSAITDHAGFAESAQQMARWAADIREKLRVKRIGVTSLGGGTADAPVAAVALARVLSRAGNRVIVVDLASTDSLVGVLCGAAEGPGVSNLIAGTAPVTKVIVRDVRSGVHILRFGTDHSARTAELVRERIETVLNALGNTYQVVIVNLGETTGDTAHYLQKCQAALIMAPASRLADAASAIQTLISSGLSAAQHVLIGNPAAVPADSLVEAEEAVSG